MNPSAGKLTRIRRYLGATFWLSFAVYAIFGVLRVNCGSECPAGCTATGTHCYNGPGQCGAVEWHTCADASSYDTTLLCAGFLLAFTGVGVYLVRPTRPKDTDVSVNDVPVAVPVNVVTVAEAPPVEGDGEGEASSESAADKAAETAV